MSVGRKTQIIKKKRKKQQQHTVVSEPLMTHLMRSWTNKKQLMDWYIKLLLRWIIIALRCAVMAWYNNEAALYLPWCKPNK